MLLTGLPVSARRAWQAGFFCRLAPAGALLAQARGLMARWDLEAASDPGSTVLDE
jgi:enoyl-CoA hydratase/carnithine racemase